MMYGLKELEQINYSIGCYDKVITMCNQCWNDYSGICYECGRYRDSDGFEEDYDDNPLDEL
jgi:hypothetical protein